MILIYELIYNILIVITTYLLTYNLINTMYTYIYIIYRSYIILDTIVYYINTNYISLTIP